MTLVVSGLLNKQVGGELGISEITVKAHRGQVMRKMQARTFADLMNMNARLLLLQRAASADHGAVANAFSPFQEVPMNELTDARLKTARDHITLEGTQDWDGVIATFAHPRYEMYGSGVVYDGEAAVRGYFAATRTPFPDQRAEIIAMAADGDTVLVEFWVTGTHLGPLKLAIRTVEPSGKTFQWYEAR